MAFSFSISVTDPRNVFGTNLSLLEADLTQALTDWSQYISGLGTLLVNVVAASTSTGTASGGSTTTVNIGTSATGAKVVEGSAEYELATGKHVAGTTSDLTVTIDPNYLSQLYLNANPGAGGTPLNTGVDAVSVFRHELTHGFGMYGYYGQNGTLSANGGNLTNFDALISKNADGTAYFTGTAAEAVNGGPVQLTTDSNFGENYYHFAQSTTARNGQDLMNGQYFYWGKSYAISPLDRAVLSDLGLTMITPATYNIDNALSSNSQGYLASAIVVADSAANVQSALDSLQSLMASGGLKAISLTDSGTPTMTVTAVQAATDAATLHVLGGSFSLSVTGTTASIAAFLAKEDVAGRGLNGVAADYAGTAPAGGNSVIGFQNGSFGSGYDTVVLDNPRSSYAVQVNANGGTTIKDIGAGDATYGQSVTVSGGSYLIFNGATATTVSDLPVYNQIYFIESPSNAQLAEFYAGATQFKTGIALSGLEYWETQLAGGTSLASIAQSFLSTGYFQTTYGDPGSTHAQHVSFIQALYQNILGMPLSAANSGVAYWAGQMDGGILSAAQTLISFTNATANTATINAVSGVSAGAGSGWLITPSLTGGYADPGLQLAAAAVLAQAATSNFYNLSLIDPTSLGASGITSGGVTVASGAVTLGSSAAAATVYLSPSFTQATVNNNWTSIHDGPGSDIITVNGNSDIVTLGSATTDILNLANASGTYVFNFAPAKGSLLAASGIAHPTGTTLLNGTTAVVNGSALTFGNSPIYVNIGSVGGGSATEVASAANSAYHVADASGEHVLFLGTDSGGNAQIWSFTAHAADSHQVITSELTQIVIVIGTAASGLTAADLA